ncbi:MAG TPA: DUF72 domain-containing protein [Candidatus Dormibacteraeota bacterium]|nr:DUF72 domain-containing protein [Candidatus Dormibacteraeota bacterium]
MTLEQPECFIGTSGFSYSAWRGTFYPRRIRPDEMIAYYATRLRTVEVNTTFYRTQPEGVIQQWAAAVPPEFRFAVKAHRRITHNRRMPNLEEAMRVLAVEAAAFGDRLGPVLFQMPPTAPFDDGRIERIVALAPNHWRIAFQFRHPSWHTEPVASTVERLGAALAYGDGEEHPGLLGRGAFVYLRLRHDRYSPQRLALWGRRISAFLDSGRDVYAYLKHEKLGPIYSEKLDGRVRTSFRVPVEVGI